MELKFENFKGEERIIAAVKNYKEIKKEIKKFLDEHNFKSCNKRVIDDEQFLTFDVGSYTEFFKLCGTEKELERVWHEVWEYGEL